MSKREGYNCYAENFSKLLEGAAEEDGFNWGGASFRCIDELLFQMNHYERNFAE